MSTKNSPTRHSDTDIRKLCDSELLPEFTAKSQRAKRRRHPSDEDFTDELAVFKDEIRDLIRDLLSTQNSRLDKLESHILEIRKQYSYIENSNKEIEKSMTFMSNQLTSLEAKITCLEKEKASVAIHMSEIDEKIDILDHSIMKTCIELRNIPKNPRETKENLYEMVQQLSKTLNIDLQSSDIRDVVRQPSKKEYKTSSVSVEFSNTLIKSQFLKSSKVFNNQNPSAKLNSSHVGLCDPKVPLYVAEKLTTKARRLFFVTRNFAKSHNFKYCWTANGRIMIRKDSESAYTIIKNEPQLQQLAQSPQKI
nr:uncharacterized protein LOC117989073 [Maniola hyperantus]